MNTIELEKYLQKFISRDVEIIVCAIDKLPKKLKNGRAYAIIINLSKSNEMGSHWCAIYIDKGCCGSLSRNGSYFDSYGFKPRSWYLLEFIEKNCKRIIYNTRQIQQLTSKVCGMYASCFLIHMIKGGTLASFVQKFSKNLLINDQFINRNYNYYLRN